MPRSSATPASPISPISPASPPVPRQLDYRQLARTMAVARVAVGAALTAAPSLTARPWVGPAASDPATKVAFRAMGVRDLALGAGALHALSRAEGARPWIALGGLSDAVDAVATLLAARRLPWRGTALLLAIASGSAAVAAVAQSRVD
jgi:hypothetical protein